MSGGWTRRDFMTTAAAAAAGLAVWPGAGAAEARSGAREDGTVVLFQGDSITDGGRNRSATGPNNSGGLGTGYPVLIASAALLEHPDRDLKFYNRGISGNRVPDLDARWEQDALALQPDILSILIGVNDIWHKLQGRYSGTVADYETGYAALLERTRRALPNTKIVVLEPFVLRTGAVDSRWFPEFDERRAAAKRVAERAGAVFIPLQSMFDELSSRKDPAYWAYDGVHPTPAGHAAIARRWREVVGL